jgi:aryl-alcohol dehydrogenase-like predicted oxidoreductase
MRFKLLGRTGLRVAELCLGAMTFGEVWGWGASKEESKKIFDAYAEAGGNFIDTANRYTEGISEKYVGEFTASEREYWVVATKYTISMRSGDPNAAGNHRKNMMQSVEASLKRLRTDYIDLLWVHAWDNMTPVDEVMRGLEDLVRMGKVLYIGISDTPAWIVSQANTLADFRGWSPFVALQIEYSLIERTVERELIPMAKAFDLALTPWAPLGGGVLTGKYANAQEPSLVPDSKRAANNEMRLTEKNLDISIEVGEIARQIGCAPSQVAINWVRKKGDVIVPIIGARTEEQMIENLKCLEYDLTDEQMKKLDDISAVDLGFPHHFLDHDHIRQLVLGDHHNNIDNHRMK